MKKLSRRALLRGTAGGIAIGLPWLAAMERPTAAAAFPKRLVVFFSANGTIPSAWAPSGSETSFELGSILAPLEPHKQDLIIVDGVDNQVAYESPGDGHQTGMGCMLTGMPLLEGTEFCLGSCDDPNNTVGWGGGISVDQHVANEIAKKTLTKFSSLEFGVQVKSNTIWSRMSYAGADQPIPPRDDPWQNFEDLFGDLTADPFGLAERRAKRHSVLDYVSSDFERLNSRLSGDDRIKLEQHLHAVREIEKRLDVANELGGACALPTLDAPVDVYKNDNFPLIAKLQMDQLVMALACDMTRVASIQFSRSVSNTNFPWLGIEEGHHDLSHDADDNQASVDKLIKINTWYAEQFAYLIDKLAAVPEGDGSMLDNTVVLWCNELGKGNSHTRRDVPFVLAGSCGGYYKTGRYLSYDGDPHNNLLLSLCHAMDAPVTSFGDPDNCTGELVGLKS